MFYEIYRHEHEGEAMYIAKNTRISHAICVLYHDDPVPPCNNKNINRKELYDFYYMAITLTTGYNTLYNLVTLYASVQYLHCNHFYNTHS